MVDLANPYAPSDSADEIPPETPPVTDALKLRSPAVSVALWSFVCIVSAVPSFIWGLSHIAQNQAFAMCVGVFIFVVLYSWGDQMTQRQPWRQFGPMRLALKIGYSTRLLLTLVFPIGASLDLICGLMSVSMVQAVWPGVADHSSGIAGSGAQVGFAGALVITLVQGVVLNVVLIGYMTLVLGIIMAIHTWKRG